MTSETHVMHHLRKSTGSSQPSEACEHEYLVPETENMALTDTHRIDIPASLNSVASKGMYYFAVENDNNQNYPYI